MKTYSPTQTQRYLTCPTLWDLHKRWRPRYDPDEKGGVKRLLGTAIHKGLATFYAGSTEAACFAEAQAVLQAGHVESDEWTLDGLVKVVNKSLKVALKDAPDIIAGGKVIGVELNLGGRVIDLLHRTAEGRLVVTDHKYAHYLNPDYIADRMAEAEHSWQLLDYASAIEEKHGEVPERAQTNLIIGSPRACTRVTPVPIDQARLDQWRRSAEVVWSNMDEGRINMNTTACRNKGLHFGSICPFYKACHSPAIQGDELFMISDFEKVERNSHDSD